jgi:hypothetical protein
MRNFEEGHRFVGQNSNFKTMNKQFLLLTAITLFGAMTMNSCKEEEKGLYADFNPAQFKQNTCAEADSLSSPNGTQPTSILFKNESSETLNIYWVNFSGGLTLYHENLTPGQSKTQGTFLQHPWYITTADDACFTVLTALRPVVTDTVVFRD